MCSAVANGNGGHLLHFLNDIEIPKDKWPLLLGSSSLCSAVDNGKGGNLIRFLNGAEIPKDTWPSLRNKR